MSQLVSLEQLTSSKVYVNPSSDVKYDHPLDYITPLWDILSPLNPQFVFEAQVGGVNREKTLELDGVSVDGADNISYSRLSVKAKLGEGFDVNVGFPTDFSHMNGEIGFVYALDTGSPELRAYAGKRVSVCLNQCIFGADNVVSINLNKSKRTVIYDSIRKYVDEASKETQRYMDMAQRLYDRKLAGERLYARIGQISWEARRRPKLGIQFANEMLSLLQNPKTRYSLDQDGGTDEWRLYNACTEALKKANILDESAKVHLLEDVFKYEFRQN